MPCLGQNLPIKGSLNRIHTNQRGTRADTSHERKARARLGNEVTALAVVCSLIFEPLPVSLHAANFLAVVVRDGVRNRVGGRVNTEALDTVEELLLFL